LLKKACDDGSDPHLALLELQNTPIQGVGLSPMQLLMGRCGKTLIPIKQFLLKPMAYDGERVQQSLTEKQKIQKKYFDRGSKTLTPLQEGDTVRIRCGNTWEPARLVGESKQGEPRLFVVTANNKEYRWNRKHILKTSEEIRSSPEKTSTIDMEEPVYSEYDTVGVYGEKQIETSGNSIQEETNGTLVKSLVVSKVSGRVIRRPARYMP
jgi:hypothetical protein